MTRGTWRTLTCALALTAVLTGCQGVSMNSSGGQPGSPGQPGQGGQPGAPGQPGTAGGGAQTESGQQSYPQPVNRLEIDSDSGGVVVRPGPGPGAEVGHTLRWTGEKPQLTQDVQGDTLRITARCPNGGGSNRCEVDLTVTLPASAAVRTDVAAGSIAVTDLAGDLQLQSRAGGVTGERLRSGTVGARSMAGRVELTFASPPRSVDAQSTAGSVAVYVPRGGPGYAVNASTTAGRVNVEVPDQPGAQSTISARSTAGSVTVGYR